MISSLYLRNFKCFQDQHFEFGSLTLLAGLNGMGKSSLLQAFLLLRQSMELGLLKEKGLALNGDLVRLGTARDVLFEGAPDEKIEFEVSLINGIKSRWRFGYMQEADVLALEDSQIVPEIFRLSLFGQNFKYLQAERLGPRRFFEMSDYQVRQRQQLGTRGEYTAHFLSVFGDQISVNKKLCHPNTNSEHLRDQVEAWLQEVSPGTRIHILAHKDMDLVNLEYSFITGKLLSANYRATNVGFGITYTLPVLVALLSSIPGSLILLENPEAHLHPGGQVKIGQLMALAADSGAQIIVETHSDHVLNGIRLASYNQEIDHQGVKLHFFERKKNNQGQVSIVSPSMDENGRIDQWPEGFFDVWDKCLEALLEPKDK
jgi:predicted ATPase